MILISFASYAPVILYAARVPALGTPMTPKALADVAISVAAYRQIFQAKEIRHRSTTIHGASVAP
jgi:hypothetical protein